MEEIKRKREESEVKSSLYSEGQMEMQQNFEQIFNEDPEYLEQAGLKLRPEEQEQLDEKLKAVELQQMFEKNFVNRIEPDPEPMQFDDNYDVNQSNQQLLKEKLTEPKDNKVAARSATGFNRVTAGGLNRQIDQVPPQRMDATGIIPKPVQEVKQNNFWASGMKMSGSAITAPQQNEQPDKPIEATEVSSIRISDSEEAKDDEEAQLPI